MDRRSFLRQAAFFTVTSAGPGPFARAQRSPDPGREPSRFPQGVAAGDPRADSLVFWTRCTPQSGSKARVPLLLQVARDAAFRQTVAAVPLVADAQWDHTVRAKVIGLEPSMRYHYRYFAGGDVSAAGSARTAPTPDSTTPQLRFAWLTCQDWSVNHWGAMSLLAAEELDFVVHVGDYIYEWVTVPPGAVEPSHPPIVLPDGSSLPDGTRYATTLADYRTLYRTYRSDPRLQAVHARHAMISTWDDHEFSDDCWQDHQTYTNANAQQTARRRAASQAWVEYMPVDFGDVSFDSASQAYDNLRIYREFHFGTLMHLVMTDERLYRDDHVVPEAAIAAALGHDPVNGDDPVGSRYFVQQPVLAQFEAAKTAAYGRAPSILGTTQTTWWKETLRTSAATWKVWGNGVMLSRMWLDLRSAAPPPFDALYVVNADSWDGYPSHKADLLGFLRAQGITNVIAVTGDLHAFQCGVVRDVPDPVVGTPVAVDFVCAGISSTSFYRIVSAAAAGTPLEPLVASPALFDAVVRAHNPDFQYVDHDAQGYASAVLTPTSCVVTFTKVKPLNADGSTPSDPLAKRTRITLLAGGAAPLVEDLV